MLMCLVQDTGASASEAAAQQAALEQENTRLEAEVAEAEQQQAEATELGSRLEDVDTKVDQLTAARTRKYTPHHAPISYAHSYTSIVYSFYLC